MLFDLLLERSRRRLHAQEINPEVTETADELPVDRGYRPEFGARPLRHAILAQCPLSPAVRFGLLMPVARPFLMSSWVITRVPRPPAAPPAGCGRMEDRFGSENQAGNTR
ncbi:hypothetical protein [Streptomyces sp. NPDC055681]